MSILSDVINLCIAKTQKWIELLIVYIINICE